jgi:hypothetical protein
MNVTVSKAKLTNRRALHPSPIRLSAPYPRLSLTPLVLPMDSNFSSKVSTAPPSGHDRLRTATKSLLYTLDEGPVGSPFETPFYKSP